MVTHVPSQVWWIQLDPVDDEQAHPLHRQQRGARTCPSYTASELVTYARSKGRMTKQRDD